MKKILTIIIIAFVTSVNAQNKDVEILFSDNTLMVDVSFSNNKYIFSADDEITCPTLVIENPIFQTGGIMLKIKGDDSNERFSIGYVTDVNDIDHTFHETERISRTDGNKFEIDPIPEKTLFAIRYYGNPGQSNTINSIVAIRK